MIEASCGAAQPLSKDMESTQPVLGGAVTSRDFVSIQILRALAALMVVVWHSHLSVKHFVHSYLPTDDREFLRLHCPSVFNHLYFGVDIFFCISGFIMTMLVVRGGEDRPGVFILRRVTRIFPMYWLFSLIVLAVCMINPRFSVAGFSGNAAADFKHAIFSLLLLPEGQAPMLGVGWTLVQEMGFYFSIFVLLLLNGGRFVVAWIALIASVMLIAGLGAAPARADGFISVFYPEFMFGALAYKFHPYVSGRWAALQLSLAVLFYALLSAASDFWPIPEISEIRIVGCGLVGFLLICGSIGMEPRLNRSFARFFKAIGDSSYVLYLSHWLVLSFLGKIGAALFPGLGAVGVAGWHVASISAAVGVGYAIHRLVEKPLNLRLRKWLEHTRASSLFGRGARAFLPAER
ncbi:acyltransferase family protein [Methylocystis heyeri]|uniref:acyltransferase family protein n=1 Tax=Methylocystis heyeri TaxID=391905 RepID=UPI0011375961|nr:acyltransferase [Methylocystis heyeri]